MNEPLGFMEEYLNWLDPSAPEVKHKFRFLPEAIYRRRYEENEKMVTETIRGEVTKPFGEITSEKNLNLVTDMDATDSHLDQEGRVSKIFYGLFDRERRYK